MECAIKKWIREQLVGTSVTVVLIGTETSSRDYVNTNKKELEKGNGILGIYIHQIKNKDGKTSTKGSNSFGPFLQVRMMTKNIFMKDLTLMIGLTMMVITIWANGLKLLQRKQSINN